MSSGSRPPRRDSMRNRERLIAAARAVFAERGLDAPLDVVAKHAGLANATLYRHFPDRSALILETLRLTLRRHDQQIRDALALATGWAGFEHLIRWEFAEQRTDASLSQSLLTVRAGLDDEVDALRQLTLDGIVALIDRAKAEGDFRADRWLDDVLIFFEANDRIAGRGGAGAEAASERLLELALDAFTAHPRDRGPDEPATVRAVRRAFAHRLRGLPLESDDL